jgi:hypothetical protein
MSTLKPRKQPSRLLVAVDGSDTSMKASDYAVTIARRDTNNDNKEATRFLS